MVKKNLKRKKSSRSKKKHKIKSMLIQLGICEQSSIKPYYPHVRDREDIAVFKCQKSGVIILSDSSHMDNSHYEKKEYFRYCHPGDRKYAINTGLEDLIRRKKLLQQIVSNRMWLDVGTGSGGILDQLSPLASQVVAVEPQEMARDILQDLGYQVYPDIKSVAESEFDVVTLFHCFEHFTDPLEELRQIYKKMSRQGKLIIEVPHANDFLLSFLDLESFKKFTFWSEHLILHTRFSLGCFLEKAGFKQIVIEGCQRYPLANHLYWLSQNQPGGHLKWSFLRSEELDSAYEHLLAQIDKTDTIIATAVKL